MDLSPTAWTTAQAGIPTVLVGDYGIGKTTCCNIFAKWLGYKLIHLPLIGACAEDLIGYPTVQQVEVKGRKVPVTVPAIHSWFVSIINTPKTVILLDEIGRLDQERMQNVVAQILDRSLGQFSLPENTIILATTNTFDIGGLNEINYNILTRVAWYNVTVSEEEERDALLTGKYKIEEKFKKLPDNWRTYETLARLRLSGFRQVRSTLFKRDEHIKTPDTTWANPRTINKFAIPALAAAYSVGYDTLQDHFDVLSACVGVAFATQFREWIQRMDLPRPEDVLAELRKKNKVKLPTDRGGRINTATTITIFTEVLTYIARKESKEDWQLVINYIADTLYDLCPEAAVFLAFSMVKLKDLHGVVPPKLWRALGPLRE